MKSIPFLSIQRKIIGEPLNNLFDERRKRLDVLQNASGFLYVGLIRIL